MASVVVNGDTSGAVTLSAPAVAGTVTVTLPASSGTMLTTASSTGISGSAISSGTVPEAYGGTGTSTGYYGFKNRIINGAMVIDQRNAGASVTPTGSLTYLVDRWASQGSAASKFTVQQNAGGVTPPAGFINYLGATVAASANVTIGSTDVYFINQKIEGFNTADLGWGTANASTVTLSFWVRSSLTGTFGGSVYNSAADRSYPYTYTISVANTWEKKTVTIAGDTSGTWLSTNGIGATVLFALGYGTTYQGTANAWQSGFYGTATGTVAPIATNSATFYITGVQLEKGSTATSFDYRPYTTELQLCQRYFETSFNAGTAPANNTDDGFFTVASGTSNTTAHVVFAVAKRASPTMTFYSSNIMASPTPTNGQWQFNDGTSWGNGSSTQTNRARMYGFSAYLVMGLAGGYAAPVGGNWIASSEL